MPISRLADVRQYVRQLLGWHGGDHVVDGQLLEQYLLQGDETAFAALVQRYGSLVLGVCERVLGDKHLAEDAFQATFLVLVRRASSLDRRGSLGNWLYAVAYRTALKARANVARRSNRERLGLDMQVAQPVEEATWNELGPVLDEELNQLPEKYRAPLVLCCLQGKTHQEAARELGWPSGSMSRRMDRARELLRERLARRGVQLTAVLLLMLLTRRGASAGVTSGLIQATVQAANAFGAHSVAAGSAAPATVSSLADATLRTTLTPALAGGSKALVVLSLIGVIGASGGLVTHELLASGQTAKSGKTNCGQSRATVNQDLLKSPRADVSSN